MPTLDEIRKKMLTAALQGKEYLVDRASNLAPSVSIGGMTSAIDSKKRLLAESLRQIATDPGEFFSQAVALQKGPSAAAQADPNALLASPGGTVSVGGIPGVMTYHGTPHNVSAYDLSKVGTGEGAQSYGHGMYFAENPAVAGSYKEAGSPFGWVIDGKRYGGSTVSNDAGAAAYAANALDRFNGDKAAAIKWLNNYGMEYEAKKLLRSAKTVEKAQGNLYKQDLPDEVLPKMLQWDKPLSEQPAYVKQRLQDFIDAQGGDLHAGDLIRSGDVEEILKARGIPGVSYLDQGSRAAGKGTMNHVVWDQELLDRMKPVPHE